MKYWPTNDPNQYRLSKRLSVDNTSYLVCDLSPRVEYSFQVLWVSQNKSHEWIFVWLLQVIAVEEKGQWGVDYNRGETTSYTIAGGLLKNKDFCKKRGCFWYWFFRLKVVEILVLMLTLWLTSRSPSLHRFEGLLYWASTCDSGSIRANPKPLEIWG